MTTTGPIVPPPVQDGPPAPPRADADGAAIASLIMAFVIPPLGIVFGAVHIAQARRRGQLPSGVADWGMVLGILLTIGMIILVITLAVAASHAASFQDCVNNAILNGQDPNAICTP